MGESVALKARALARKLGHTALDLLFPPVCVGCGRAGEIWCRTCQGAARRLPGPRCPTCGGRTRGHGVPCRWCESRSTVLQVRSCWRYEPPISRALLHLKYRPDRRVARILGGQLAHTARLAGWSPSLIVPVPLGPARLRERGFNQAALLAEACSNALGVPWSQHVLVRHRETRSQVGLDPVARRENVKGAFRVVGEIQGEWVVVVDDLLTTGATLRSCGRALLEAGAGAICGLTVARAVAGRGGPGPRPVQKS